MSNIYILEITKSTDNIFTEISYAGGGTINMKHTGQDLSLNPWVDLEGMAETFFGIRSCCISKRHHRIQ